MSESIYNLTATLPPAETMRQITATQRGFGASAAALAPVYHSKFPHNTLPTGSTFGNAGRSLGSVVDAGNYSGQYNDGGRAHASKREGATFGPPNAQRPDPSNPLRKTLSLGPGDLPEPTKFAYPDVQPRRAPVPLRHERPLMNTFSGTNFVAENVKAMAGAQPPKPAESKVDYINKADYGQVPAYLHSVRAEIEAEKQALRQAVDAQRRSFTRSQPQHKLMPEEERLALLSDLKKRWQQVNFDYQRAAHYQQPLDTVGKVRRREYCEAQLQMLEESIEKLSKEFVYVREDAQY